MTEKIILITGATRGLGLESARQLLQKGATVILSGRDVSRGEAILSELKSSYPQAHFIPMDMRQPDEADQMYEQIKTRYGRLDVLINNAAITSASHVPNTGARFSNTILSADITAIKTLFETNVWGLLHLTRKLLPLLEVSLAGRIINMSSELGSLHYQSDPASPIYNVKNFGYNSSKTMVNLITIYFQELLVNTNVHVYALSPGWVKTEMGTEAAFLEVPAGAAIMVKAALEEIPVKGFITHHWETIPW